MYKLQVVLVPPNSFDGPLMPPMISATTEDSQVLPSKIHGNASSIAGAVRPDILTTGNSNNNLFMSSFMSSHIPQPKLKKFLHFTRPSNTLLALAEEIVAKCQKIYPNLKQDVEILTLQDVNECDLDPDFIVKDVFNVDNIVRAVLRDEVEASDEEMQSLYTVKRRKLNNSAPVASNQPNVLRIAKKRPHILKSSTMRISTPLANQIYPPPGGEQINSDYEDDDLGDRSVLPPPQPQSPPIRISSGIDNNKKMNFNENTVSKSETVDPDKSRQQRLSSGTPMRQTNNFATMTPNKIVLTGQRVMTEPSIVNRSLASPITTNKRITSGMLRIPEPKISEVEEELREGPASPSAELPSRPDRIPMKKPYVPQSEEDQSSSSSAEEEQRSSIVNRPQSEGLGLKSPSAARQTSIADNNGSPIKEGVKIGNVNLAELPTSQKKAQRKSSLETKVESLMKNAASLSEVAKDVPTHYHDESGTVNRKDTFSEEEDDADEEEQFQQDPNDTVRVNHTESGGNASFQKSDLLSMLKGNKFEIPLNFNDPSKTIPNAIHQRVQRTAARKAAELLSSGKSRTEESSTSSEDESSNIETDLSENENDRIMVLENHALKKLNIHPLKERVIGDGQNETIIPEVLTKDKKQSSMEGKNSGEPSLEMKNVLSSKNLNTSSLSVGSAVSATEGLVKDTNITGTNEETDVSKSKSGITASKSPSKKGLPPKFVKAISPPPADKETIIYQTPEYVEDSDDETDFKAGGTNTTSKPSEKRLPPSVLKRKEEAERKRKEREALKKAKEEESAKKRAEREAKKLEKEKELAMRKANRAARKKAKEEEAIRRKTEREINQKTEHDTKGPKMGTEDELHHALEVETKKPAHDNQDNALSEITSKDSLKKAENVNVEGVKPSKSKSTEVNGVDRPKKADTAVTPDPGEMARYFATAEKRKSANDTADQETSASEVASTTSKLETLKTKFATGRSPMNGVTRASPIRNVSKTLHLSENESSFEITDESESSEENDSSGDSSEEETSLNKKIRRGIVDTPKGAMVSVPKKVSDNDISAVESAPQSTQRPLSSDSTQPTPVKIPVTKMMELSSPAVSSKTSRLSEDQSKHESKPGRSLSSLSDLVSRGVPEVKDGSLENTKKPKSALLEQESSSDNESDNESEEDTDASDSESSDSSDEEESSNFISAKSASKVLGKKKSSNSGFASLVKDSKKR